MRVALDTDTGAVIAPEAMPAYLAHPSNAGRFVTVRIMDTFTAPAGLPTRRSAIAPSQGSEAELAGATPDGVPPNAVGADRTRRSN
jgi:hypothetical protein